MPKANPGHDVVHPPDFVLGQKPDVVAVRGMGTGAYGRFDAAGVRIVLAEEGTVQATLDAAQEGRLEPFPEDRLHRGHHHG